MIRRVYLLSITLLLLILSTPLFSFDNDANINLLYDNQFFPVLIKHIEYAKKEIIFSVFQFKTSSKIGSFPDRVVESLELAAKRGVDTVVILEDGANNIEVYKTNMETAKKLKAAGVKVFFDSNRTTNHTKIYIFDEKYAIIGSHNLTQSALKYNSEASILIDSPAVTKKIKEYVERLKKVKF